MAVKWESECGWGGYRARLAPGLTISAAYDFMLPKGSSEPPYVASVFGLRMKKRFDNIDDAKAAAVRLAWKGLTDALEALT